MNRFQTASVLWLAAAVTSAAATIIFRGDDVWYVITLVASGVAAVLGILLLWRPTAPTVLVSTIAGAAWVVLYAALVVIQSDDIQAWTADAFFALLGGAASFIGYRAGRQAAT